MHQLISSFQNGVFDLIHPPARNIVNLDVLRSLAILLVFSGHIAGEFQASRLMQKLPPVYFGWTGVDLFFVLSGYLIGSQIWRELRNTGTVRLGRFLLRRGLRIWPLYFSFVFLVAAEGVFMHRSVTGLWADATCLSNYFHHEIGGGWSLSTEEQFYILFPVAILALASFLSPKKMGWLPFAALLLLPLSRQLTLTHYSALSITQARDMMYYPIHTHSDGLAAGVLIAWLQTFRPNYIATLHQWAAIAVISPVLGVALYVLNRDIFNYSTLALVFGGTLVMAIGWKTAWPSLIATPFYVISRLSYGIYLNHFGLLPRLAKFIGNHQTGNNFVFLAEYVLCFAVCVAFAALTFLLIENPFLKLRERWTQKQIVSDVADFAIK